MGVTVYFNGTCYRFESAEIFEAFLEECCDECGNVCDCDCRIECD